VVCAWSSTARPENLAEHRKRDPFPRFLQQLLDLRFQLDGLKQIEQKAIARVKADFEKAHAPPRIPTPEDLTTHMFAPTPITEEKGERAPFGPRTHGDGGLAPSSPSAS
jgi:2-oxoisovalerate dehydrogenase E1 component